MLAPSARARGAGGGAHTRGGGFYSSSSCRRGRGAVWPLVKGVSSEGARLSSMRSATGVTEWVPTIDVSALSDSSGPLRAQCIQQMAQACAESGFFYAVNHGVAPATIDAAMEAAGAFFSLDKEDKLTIDNAKSAAFRGYIAQGLENTNGVVDEREQIEFGVESEAAPPGVMPYYLRLQGPNQWPSDATCPDFRPAVETFAVEMEEEARRLTGALAEVLGDNSDVWDRFFDDPFVQMKICRYPGLESADAGVSGVGAHSDSGFLSMLVQDDAGGLQAQLPNGDWVDVPPIKHAIVVNLGEVLQVMSGGKLRATVHRVQRTQRNRISVPYFWNPRLETTLADLGVSTGDASTSSGTHGGRNEVFLEYGANAFKSLARSHPRVMDRHHPDLCVVDGRVMVANAAR